MAGPAGNRGEVDDVPSPALAYQRHRRLRAVEEPEQVDVDHLAPLVGFGALDRAEQHHAGVVDEDVEAAHLLGGALDEGAGGRLVADVDLEGVGGAAVGVDPLGELVEAVLAPRPQRHAGSLAGQCQRGRLSDSRRGAGDNRPASLQCVRHGSKSIAGFRPQGLKPFCEVLLAQGSPIPCMNDTEFARKLGMDRPLFA